MTIQVLRCIIDEVESDKRKIQFTHKIFSDTLDTMVCIAFLKPWSLWKQLMRIYLNELAPVPLRCIFAMMVVIFIGHVPYLLLYRVSATDAGKRTSLQNNGEHEMCPEMQSNQIHL